MANREIQYTPYNPQFKKTEYPHESWSYIAPSWEDMSYVYLDLAADMLRSNGTYDILVTLAKGGWTWSRTMADVLQIPEIISFKLTFYDPKEPGRKLEKPVLETPLTVPLIGKKVLLFDDVDDTGDSFLWSQQYLSHFGAASITTATLFHKPHSKIHPDFFGVETDAWIIFPHERRETITGLAKKWQNEQVPVAEIIHRLKEIGLPEKEIDLFLRLENYLDG